MALFQTDNLRIELPDAGVALLELDVPGKNLNVFNRVLMADLDAALDRVAAESALRLLLVRSAKVAGFLAGADLHEFETVRTPDDARELSALGQRVFGKLAGLRVPSVAVVHGVCLGGGLEVALACDYRLVIDHPATLFGLPEVELGLLPAWGGTQRLPLVVGLERALLMILGGRRVDADTAKRWGLADRTLPPTPALSPKQVCELAEGVAWQGKRLRKGLPLRTWRQGLLESNAFGRRLIFGGSERLLRRRVPDDMPAPYEALEAVRVGVKQGMEAGLAFEREAAARLVLSPACRSLVNLFFQREKARKLPDEARADAGRKVRKVGIVGAGVMGAGIAQLAALRGCEVVLQEASIDALGAGTMRLAGLFQKALDRRLITPEEYQKKLAAVRGTVDWEGFDDVDLVIEAAVEKLETKKKIFHDLERHTRPTAVLATNTSSLSVAQLQDGLKHPQRVAGLHFFNPVHKMPLVEVARAPATDERAVALLRGWAVHLGKTPVLVRDSPGFVVNRVLMPYLNEAVLLALEGLRFDRIDRVMVRFGMPMGPLVLLDQVGLDVAAHIAREMQPVFGARFPPNPIFELFCEKGWLGQKSGSGFYRYRGGRAHVNPLAVNVLCENPAPSPLLKALPAAGQLQQARERLVLSMVNEAALCLGERLAEDAEAIDLAMVLGTGWAPHRGGPLRYGRARGFAEVVEALARLAAALGPRFEPCPELCRLAGGDLGP